MLFAAILHSPHAHARIKRIDTSKAEKLAGVIAVVTGEDAKAWSEPVHGFPIGWAGHCLAHDKVRFVGDPVAAVAATSRYIAEDALELIEVDYEILAPVIDAQKALDPDSPVIWQHQGTNLIYHRIFTFGAVDEAFAEADVVVKDDFRWLRASGNPIETCNCIVQWRPDHSLNAWGGFQGTGFYVSSVARGLRVPAHKIRITPLPHGGSFGTKIFPHAIIRMALLSRKAGGRHVKWIEDRVEIRRRNLLRPEQFPYEAPNGARYDSGDYERTLNMALEMAGYQALREEQTRARAAGRLVGIGVYTGVELSAVAMSMFTLLGPDSPFGTSMPESARVRIDATGKIVCEVTFPWEGQGQHTFATNFLADYF